MVAKIGTNGASMPEERRCAVCGKLCQTGRTALCVRCARDSVKNAIEAAEQLLNAIDMSSMDLMDERRIDGMFYFEVYSYRWRRKVEQLRHKLFNRGDPPRCGVDPEQIPPLPKPYERAWQQIYSLLADPGSWRTDGELTDEAAERVSEVRITSKDAENYWRIHTLAATYFILEEDVWAHLLTGCEVSFADVTIEEVAVGTRSALRVTVYDPREWPQEPGQSTSAKKANQAKQVAGRSGPLQFLMEDWILAPMWKSLGRAVRKERKAKQEAGYLVRAWTCYCLQQLGGHTALQATTKWNKKFGGIGLDWGGAGEHAYSKDKHQLEKRLHPLLADEYVLPD